MTPKDCPGLNAGMHPQSRGSHLPSPGSQLVGAAASLAPDPPPQSTELMMALAAPTTSSSDEGLQRVVWVPRC